ncbi:MAG: NAD(P)-dependent oxidoreductase [Candidatus Accumulibacter propinquus]
MNLPCPPLPAADLEHILAHTGPLWRELAGSRIFITGGTGFFGIWLLETLAAANDLLKTDVGATVLSRDPQRFLARMPHLAKRSEFDWLYGHPANFPFPDRRHDYILHLATATSAHLDRTDPIEMLQTKLASIRHILDYARHTRVRRMLVTSSGAVYGPQPQELSHIPETYSGAPDPMNPASAYGQGKRLVEQMCALTPEVPYVIARCFSFIGPHLPVDARFAIGNFIRDALSGGPITVRGDGSAVRSYLYAGDLVVWLLTMLANGEGRMAYNVGSDEAVTMAELASKVSACVGNIGVQILGKPQEAPSEQYIPCLDRARKLIGLRVFTNHDASIQKTVDWYSRLTTAMSAANNSSPRADHCAR